MHALYGDAWNESGKFTTILKHTTGDKMWLAHWVQGHDKSWFAIKKTKIISKETRKTRFLCLRTICITFEEHKSLMWMLSLISWIHFIRLDWLFYFYQFNTVPHELVKNIQLCVGGQNFRNTNIPSTYSCLVSSFQNHFCYILKIIVEWWTDQVINPVQTVKYRFYWTLSNWKGTWRDLCFLIWLRWHEFTTAWVGE